MPALLTALLSWGPAFFGAFLAGPMWAAALQAMGITFPFGIPTLYATMTIGLLLGVLARLRGRWL